MKLLFFLALTVIAFPALPTVYINEVLVNGPGSCDGSCNPGTEEWVELYNDGGSAYSLDCHTLSDGDWAVRIPPGAGFSIPAGGYFTLGGASHLGGIVDFNWGSSYSYIPPASSLMGTFTNAGEQVAFFDASGNFLDGYLWGNGQSPMLPSSSVSFSIPGNPGGCSLSTITFPPINQTQLPGLPSTGWITYPTGGANGCSLARITDGAAPLDERCLASITFSGDNFPILEVEWVSVVATFNQKSDVEIKWITTNEKNNDHFIIQKGRQILEPLGEDPSYMQWKDLGSISGFGQGESQTLLSYSFVDAQPNPNEPFYRIKQVDQNGKDSFSPVTSVKVDQVAFEESMVSVFPTLFGAEARRELHVNSVFLVESMNYQVTIRDMGGATVTHQKFKGQFETVLDLSSLASGFYIVSVQTETGLNKTQKIIIQ